MITVACAIIMQSGKVLVAQRNLHKAEGGLWEFPGGKLEETETAEACIVREIAEELALQVQPFHSLPAVVHHYPHKSICLVPLLCQLLEGSLQLREHNDYRWATPQELPHFNWCPADVPVVASYLQWLEQQA